MSGGVSHDITLICEDERGERDISDCLAYGVDDGDTGSDSSDQDTDDSSGESSTTFREGCISVAPSGMDGGGLDAVSTVQRGQDGGDNKKGAGCATRRGPTFVLVAKEHLVGTWLAVFVRASMLSDVSDIRTGWSVGQASCLRFLP